MPFDSQSYLLASAPTFSDLQIVILSMVIAALVLIISHTIRNRRRLAADRRALQAWRRDEIAREVRDYFGAPPRRR